VVRLDNQVLREDSAVTLGEIHVGPRRAELWGTGDEREVLLDHVRKRLHRNLSWHRSITKKFFFGDRYDTA
jgi:hypothetical protein